MIMALINATTIGIMFVMLSIIIRMLNTFEVKWMSNGIGKFPLS